MMRAFWLGFGLFAQALFLFTVARLFPFLRGGGYFTGFFAEAIGPWAPWYAIDALLAAQFTVIHSVLLLPKARSALGRRMPPALYGCVFCAATCLCLLLTTEAWQPCPSGIWRIEGTPARIVEWAFLASWIALIYSLSLTGLGYQTGLTPWWAWARGHRVPVREFAPKGAYRVLRHPVYLSFLGLVWFNPGMTYDRLILAAIWTIHIFVGSYLKDRRLVHYIGESYRKYQRSVPGYPFMPLGPLGKLRS